MVGSPRGAASPLIRSAVVTVMLALLASTALAGAASPRAGSGTRAAPLDARVGPAFGVVPPVATGGNPFITGMPASLVVGQTSFTFGASGSGPANLSFPEKMAFDAYGDLFVVDGQNSRVLEFVPPLKPGMNASVAIGQISLSAHLGGVTNQSTLWEPDGLAFDARGDLWVADTTNNRVLEFLPPFKTGMSANLVLGQPTYISKLPATSSTGMHYPGGLAFDAQGDLFVADTANDRVLVFVPPFTPDMGASAVIGQSSFTTSGAGTTATNLSYPAGVALSPAGDLWVADTDNSRVLEFVPHLVPAGVLGFSTGMAASLVLGQRNFTSTSEGLPYGMASPWDLAFDPAGELWVADSGSPNRVVEYVPPFVANETPSVAIGQTSFSGSSSGTSRTLLEHPRGVTFDASGDLWVSDYGNSRALEFTPSVFIVGFAETGLASGTTWSVTFDGLTVGSNNAWMTFPAWNGSYPFSVGSVGGYSATPGSGTVSVSGTNVSVAIAFTPTILGLPPSVFWPVLAVLLAVIALVEAIVLLRRRRGKPSGPLTPAPPVEPPKTAG